MGVFDTPEQLLVAVTTLREEGVSYGQLCVVAAPETMAALHFGLVGAAAEHADLARLHNQVENWPGENGRIVASSGPLLQQIRVATSLLPFGAAGIPIAGNELSEFIGQITRTTAGVIVSAQDPAEHRRTARVLLHASSHGVQTFEYSVPEY